MRSGLLSEIIYIESPVLTKSETGTETIKYNVLNKCRAYVTYTGGNRADENGDMFYTRSVKFEIRRFYDFNENCRITWNSRHYKINYIERVKSNQSIIIECELINDFEIEKEYEEE